MRPTQATYAVHECIKVDTSDNEDHTFCGIIFPIKAKRVLPIQHIVIRSVAVRGQLGPMTVWVSNEDCDGSSPNAMGQYNFRLEARYWTKVYAQTHEPSQQEYCVLDFSNAEHPVIIQPGRVRALYIHSTLAGDESIVYDNAKPLLSRRARRSKPPPRYEDTLISLGSGKAHLSNELFGQNPIWGWGNAWRDRRDFVGQIEYGAVYQLWNPEIHNHFGDAFRTAVITLLTARTRPESTLSVLPDECLFYILNMCRWDWFDDKDNSMQRRLKYLKRKRRILLAAAAMERQRAQKQKRGDGLCCAEEKKSNDGKSVTGDERQSDGDETVPASASSHEQEVATVQLPPAAAAANSNDDDEEEDDGNISDESEWERAHGYRASINFFHYQDASSDDEEEVDASTLTATASYARTLQQEWFHRSLASPNQVAAQALVDKEN